MKKLTLSASEDVIAQAKRVAARQKTSVSAMFSRYVRGLGRNDGAKDEIPADSIAARATGFLRLPRGKTPRDVLTEALLEKYRE
jgi:hypothetical protein